MNGFNPKLYSPFPGSLNPHVGSIVESTAGFVEYFRLYDPSEKRYKEAPISWRTARFYPHADAERLALADQMLALLLFMEEYSNRRPDNVRLIYDGKGEIDPVEMYKYYVAGFVNYPEQISSVLQSEPIPLPEDGPVTALHNVWERICQLSDSAWQKRFFEAVMCLQFGWSRKHDRLTPVSKFGEIHAIRPDMSTVRISTLLAEFVSSSFLPDELVQDKWIAEVTLHAQLVMGITDDLFELNLSVDKNPRYNMAMAIRKEYDISLADAVERVVELHDFELSRFLDKKNAVSENRGWIEARTQHLNSLTHLMRGNLDWWTNDVTRG